MDKKEAARILHLNGCKGKEIASIMRVSENTVSTWRKKYGWDKKASELTLLKETAEESVYELIAWNLKVLKHKKENWEASNEMTLIERGDIDALTKLFAAIRGKEKKWSDYVMITRELIAYLAIEDHDLSQKIIPFTDAFLNSKRSIA